MTTTINDTEIDWENTNWRVAVDGTTDELLLEHKVTGNAVQVDGSGNITLPGAMNANSATLTSADISSLAATLGATLYGGGNAITNVGAFDATSVDATTGTLADRIVEPIGKINDTDRTLAFDWSEPISGSIVKIEYIVNGANGGDINLQLDGATGLDYNFTRYDGTSASGVSAYTLASAGTTTTIGEVTILRDVTPYGMNAPSGANRLRVFGQANSPAALQTGDGPGTSAGASFRLFSTADGAAITANAYALNFDLV